jgi:hypothetical protein
LLKQLAGAGALRGGELELKEQLLRVAERAG